MVVLSSSASVYQSIKSISLWTLHPVSNISNITCQNSNRLHLASLATSTKPCHGTHLICIHTHFSCDSFLMVLLSNLWACDLVIFMLSNMRKNFWQSAKTHESHLTFNLHSNQISFSIYKVGLRQLDFSFQAWTAEWMSIRWFCALVKSYFIFSVCCLEQHLNQQYRGSLKAACNLWEALFNKKADGTHHQHKIKHCKF